MKQNVSVMRYVLVPAIIVAMVVSAIASGITCLIFFRKIALHNMNVISKLCTNLMGDFLIIADNAKRR